MLIPLRLRSDEILCGLSQCQPVLCLCRTQARKRLKKPESPVTQPSHENEVTDPKLARIVAAWPTLPKGVRLGIAAMVWTTHSAGNGTLTESEA